MTKLEGYLNCVCVHRGFVLVVLFIYFNFFSVALNMNVPLDYGSEETGVLTSPIWKLGIKK